MNPRHLFVAGFVITLGMITYGDISSCHDLPWPPRIVATALVFAMLDLFGAINEELAGVVAIGIVLAAVVNKGFSANCEHANSTIQPVDFSSLQGPPTTLA